MFEAQIYTSAECRGVALRCLFLFLRPLVCFLFTTPFGFQQKTEANVHMCPLNSSTAAAEILDDIYTE